MNKGKNILTAKPEDYHRLFKTNRSNVFDDDSYLSKSTIWSLRNSSLYDWRFGNHTIKPTPAMDWGILVDILTTSPEDFEALTVLKKYDSFRSKEAQDWRDEQQAKNKLILSNEMICEGHIAAKVLLETHKESAFIFEKSRKQVIVAGKIAGIKIKGMIDIAPFHADYLADLKTTADFSIQGFERSSANRGYYVQAGLYLALWNALFPDDQRSGFKIIWQNSKAPYEVAISSLTEEDIQAGYMIAVHLINKIASAEKSNSWPMLTDGKQLTIARPSWQVFSDNQFLEK
jgi:hypothetical protein